MADSLGLYLPAAVAYRLVGLARGVILAWLMTACEFGLFQVALLAVGVLMPLAGAGLHEAVARYVPQHEARRSLRAFVRQAGILTLAVVGLGGAIALAMSGPLARLLFASAVSESAAGGPVRWGLTCWVVLASLVMILYWFVLSVLKGLRMFLAVSLMEMAGAMGFTLAAVGAALAGWRTAEAVMVLHAACYGTVTALMAWPLLRRLRADAAQAEPLPEPGTPALCAQMLRFGVWAALAAVLWQIMEYYPMWRLQKTHGPEVTAVFGSVRLVAQAVLIGATSVVMVVQAAVTRTWETQGPAAADRQWRLAFKATVLVMLWGCAVMAAGAPLIMRLFPAGYAGGAAIVPVVLAFFMVGGQLAFVVIHFVLIEKTRCLFGLWLAGAAGNALFGAFLIRPGSPPAAALNAAAWAGLLGVAAALGVGLLWLRIERRRLDAASALLMAAPLPLVLPAYGLVGVAVGMLLLVCASDWILQREEKRRIREALGGWLARLKVVKVS